MADQRELSTDPAIKQASTAAVAADQAMVVALHPTSPLPTGTNTIGIVNIGADPDTITSGTITTTDIVVAAPAGAGAFVSGTSTVGSYVFLLAPGGDSSWGLQITGLTTGTLYFEGSLDSTNGTDGNWINVNGRQTGVVNTVLAGNATTNGMWRGNTSGLKYYRVRAVGTLTGTPAVVLRVSSGVGATFLNASIPAGTNTIGAISNTGFAVTNVGTFAAQATLSAETTKVIGTVNLSAAQTLATVTAVTAITNALPAGTNSVGTVQMPAITKNTQGATGVTTQDLKDAGRNAVHYYTLIPVLSSATDTLQTLTGTKAGATVVATATPAVVTTGKTMRITRMAATYIATATSGYGVIRLRFNTGGVVAITSPIAATMAVGSSAPTTANALDTEEATLSEGFEFAAGTGIGISVQGFAAVTAAAVGYLLVSVTGFEY